MPKSWWGPTLECIVTRLYDSRGRHEQYSRRRDVTGAVLRRSVLEQWSSSWSPEVPPGSMSRHANQNGRWSYIPLRQESCSHPNRHFGWPWAACTSGRPHRPKPIWSQSMSILPAAATSCRCLLEGKEEVEKTWWMRDRIRPCEGGGDTLGQLNMFSGGDMKNDMGPRTVRAVRNWKRECGDEVGSRVRWARGPGVSVMMPWTDELSMGITMVRRKEILISMLRT